jgi:hypothetical protein
MHQGADLRTDLAKAEVHQEENDFFYTKERRNYVVWAQRLGFLAIVASIAAIVLNSIHVAWYALPFAVTLLILSVVFFISSVLAVVWAGRLSKTYGASTELFQPRTDDRLTKGIFIGGLILAGACAVLLPNLYLQSEYSPDYVLAQSSSTQAWEANFHGKEVNDVISYFRTNFIVQSIISGFLFFYFLLLSRAAFRCLKWDNQAMSYLVFLGNVLFLLFGFGILYFANHVFGYGEYPAIRAHFPVWNVRSLYVLGLAIIVLSFVGFLIDHRSWRVGFFVLSFLLLLVLVCLVNFTGYAYRHSRQTYEFYKGIDNVKDCTTRLGLVDAQEIQDYGCPAKYLEAGACATADRVPSWESTPATGTNAFCLNHNCCGLLGRLYTDDLLELANFSLLAVVAGCFISIGCYYFWYVTWVDSARDKRKDFVWLGIMGLITVAFFAVFFSVDKDYVLERVDAAGTHL